MVYTFPKPGVITVAKMSLQFPQLDDSSCQEWFSLVHNQMILVGGCSLMTSSKKGGGGYLQKGDQKVTGGRGGYLKMVMSLMNKSIYNCLPIPIYRNWKAI